MKQRFLHESKQYAEMETGQICLAFANEEFIKDSHQFRFNRKDKQATGAEIAFIVEDVSKAYTYAVEESAIPVLTPAQKSWGQTVSYVRDNNGFIVEICDEVKG